ncbi:hypothetical protein VHEMI10241 [[Torrubiella] hemipterigena]|uniref:Phosphoribosyl-ATP pyrophosphohydrolase n=1 Tax=[Torrubiella] hemipterigena TaxID=1531966 RepID=A0A0A1TRK1_9HYPO|nr:hypothetical protein VHEMI10241 [[Torrubiella] hemipterigena]
MSSTTPVQEGSSSGEGLRKQIRCVEEFYSVFSRYPIITTPAVNIGLERIRMCHRLMAEENQEYLDAAEAGDLVEVADALGDKLYILCGTIIAHGMQDIIEDVFAEIHRSNMTKLGSDGKPIRREGDGKILKGPNYSRPDLKGIVESKVVKEEEKK